MLYLNIKSVKVFRLEKEERLKNETTQERMKNAVSLSIRLVSRMP